MVPGWPKMQNPTGAADMVSGLSFAPGWFRSIQLSVSEFTGDLLLALGLQARLAGGSTTVIQLVTGLLPLDRPRVGLKGRRAVAGLVGGHADLPGKGRWTLLGRPPGRERAVMRRRSALTGAGAAARGSTLPRIGAAANSCRSRHRFTWGLSGCGLATRRRCQTGTAMLWACRRSAARTPRSGSGQEATAARAHREKWPFAGRATGGGSLPHGIHASVAG